MTESERPSLAKLTVFACLGIIAALVWLNLAVATWKGIQAYDWPTKVGKITGSSHAQGCGRRNRQYYPTVSYRYEVEGATILGERFSFGNRPCEPGHVASELARRYAVGDIVTVYVNPASPGEAVLEPGVNFQTVLGLGILTLVLGAMAWLMVIKRKGKH